MKDFDYRGIKQRFGEYFFLVKRNKAVYPEILDDIENLLVEVQDLNTKLVIKQDSIDSQQKLIQILKKERNNIKTATIEDLKKNPHVQGLLEVLKEIEKSRYSPIGDDGDFQTPDAEMARAKLKEWE